MSLKDDLIAEVARTFTAKWDVQGTKTVPAPDDLLLNSNYAKDLEKATVLYADLSGSTAMVDSKTWQFSAEIYKNYLRCAALVIKSEGGIITAYDGDRIMAVFTGDYKNTQAVRSALKINYAVHYIINPALKVQYPNSTFKVEHVIGIDTSQLRAARIGIRGDSDIVWIGRAANHAAKLTTLSLPGYSIWITKAVYDSMYKDVKFSSRDNEHMWLERRWTAMNGQTVFCSGRTWAIS